MTGFEPRTSGVGSDRSTNSATNTAPKCTKCFEYGLLSEPFDQYLCSKFFTKSTSCGTFGITFQHVKHVI